MTHMVVASCHITVAFLADSHRQHQDDGTADTHCSSVMSAFHWAVHAGLTYVLLLTCL